MLFTVISPPSPIGRTSRRLIPICVGVGLAAVAAVVMAALSPAVAWAYCGSNDCFGNTVNSAITVVHYQPAGGSNVDAVEPDTGEDWTITAYWDTLGSAPALCDCTATANATVYVTVDWSDATKSWSSSCTGCNSVNGPIFGVTVCLDTGCGGGAQIDNSWAYELVVNAAKTNTLINCGPNPQQLGHLSRVSYGTTAVDDGNIIDGVYCTEGSSVSPTSQSFSTTDSGPFECVYSCAGAAGPQVDIVY